MFFLYHNFYSIFLLCIIWLITSLFIYDRKQIKSLIALLFTILGINFVFTKGEKFDVKYLTAEQNVHLLANQALKYHPDTVCIVNDKKKETLEHCL